MHAKFLTPLLILGATFLHSALAPPAAHADPGAKTEVVATIDGQPIPLAELEAQLADPLAKLEAQRQQLLEQGLGQLIEERLMRLEAESRGLSLEDFVTQEIDSRIKIDDAAVDAFYTANQARIRQPKEQVEDQVRTYLEREEAQQRRSQLVSGLRERHEVKLALEPHRVALPPVGKAPVRGEMDAPVTLTIFSDFQCPGCAGIEPVIDTVRESYGEKLNVVFRQYPLTSIHPQAFQAAEAALCAGDQGKFWEMHGSLFADQRNLQRADLDRRAAELELETSAFGVCLDKGDKKALVEADLRLGNAVGGGGTPTIFINGRPIDLTRLQVPAATALSRLIDDELGRKKG